MNRKYSLPLVQGNYTVVYARINGGWKKSAGIYDTLTLMGTGYGYWINATAAGSYEVGN